MKMKIRLDDGAYMPERAHSTDAGYDLRTPYRVVLHPNSNAIVRTGVHIQLPPGKAAIVISKSGLYVNHSATGIMPKIKQRVLITYENEDGLHVDFTYYDKYGFLLGEALAWKPCPEPYQTERREDGKID